MKKLVGIIAAIALVFAFAGVSAAAAKKVGTFNVKTLDGKEFKNEQIAGKKVMMVFAQMACRQCQQEMTEISENIDKFDFPVYVVLVDINTDMAAKRYADAGFNIPAVMDPDFSIPASVRVRVTPATIVLDKEGMVTYEKIGYDMGTIDDLIAATK